MSKCLEIFAPYAEKKLQAQNNFVFLDDDDDDDEACIQLLTTITKYERKHIFNIMSDIYALIKQMTHKNTSIQIIKKFLIITN